MLSLEELDNYLMSDDSPEGCFMLSDLDGFMFGIACSPVLVPPIEWMSTAMGGTLKAVPAEVISTLTARYATICNSLKSESPVAEPIFWQAAEGHVIAMDWCEGFMDAVALRPREWLRLTESGSHGHLITPIMAHLLDDNGNSVLGIPQEELDQALAEAAEQIAEAVVSIYKFWQGKR